MFNVRDLGGLPTQTGKTIRELRLLRADDPHLSTPDDRRRLETISIGVVLDLRIRSEVEHRGTSVWDEIGTRRVARPWWPHVPPMEHMHRYRDPKSTAELYGEMHEASLVNQAETWRALADASEERAVIHCASGRDRTGILVAILLSALDVPHDLILDDYAYSGVGMEQMLSHLEATHTPEELERLNLDRKAAVYTPRETIDHFLTWLRAQHGSIEGYFSAINCTEALTTLREKLLTG